MEQKFKKFLRQKAHGLKPVVMIGRNKTSDKVVEAFRVALEHHELVKVKLLVENKAEMKPLVAELQANFSCDLIQEVGFTVVFFKGNADAKLKEEFSLKF